MTGRQAKIISPSMQRRLLAAARRSPFPERDIVTVLLSTKAGLRAGEIAGLEWSMILDPRGKVANSIAIEARIAKRGSGRRIPMHPDLKNALTKLARVSDTVGPVIRSKRGGFMRANSIVNWFVKVYADLGYSGCSSHSGRRTFITTAARQVHKAGGSLRDVQLLAGHRSIAITQTYIDGDSDAQRRLVALL